MSTVPFLRACNKATTVKKICVVLSEIPGCLSKCLHASPPYQDCPCLIELFSIFMLPYLIFIP